MKMPKGKIVPLRENAQKTSYYKFIRPVEPLPESVRELIKNAKGKPGEGLEINDRKVLQSETQCPQKPGYFPLKEGGMMVHSIVEIPNIEPEAGRWWAAWHGLDPVRYAIWDPEDHYDVQVSDEDKAHLLDPDLSIEEKLYGVTHHVLESFDGDEPSTVTMQFVDPFEYGYDRALYDTPECEMIVCARALLNGKIPVFVTQVQRQDQGVRHQHECFWLGYDIENGQAKCVVPKSAVIPEEILQKLMTHNYKEFIHLNKVMKELYAQEKDHWEVDI